MEFFCARKRILNNAIITYDYADEVAIYSCFFSHILIPIVSILALRERNRFISKIFLIYSFLTMCFGLIKVNQDATKLLFVAAFWHNFCECTILYKVIGIKEEVPLVVIWIFVTSLTLIMPFELVGMIIQQTGLLFDVGMFWIGLRVGGIHQIASTFHLIGQIIPLVVSGITGGSLYQIIEPIINSTIPVTFVFQSMAINDLEEISESKLKPLSRVIKKNKWIIIKTIILSLILFTGFGLLMMKYNKCDLRHPYKSMNLIEYPGVNSTELIELQKILNTNSNNCNLLNGCIDYDFYHNVNKRQIWTYEIYNTNKTLWRNLMRAREELKNLIPKSKFYSGHNLQLFRKFDSELEYSFPDDMIQTNLF
jgi:hypothetical protein